MSHIVCNMEMFANGAINMTNSSDSGKYKLFLLGDDDNLIQTAYFQGFNVKFEKKTALLQRKSLKSGFCDCGIILLSIRSLGITNIYGNINTNVKDLFKISAA